VNKTVLIVEDYEKSLKLFKLIVGSMGYDVLTAGSSEEGVRLAREQKPDLILMDIQMPGMNGIDALGVLKKDEITRSIPVIALTSYVMKGDRERLVAAGFTHYIPKPIDKTTFMNDVQRLLEG
jgi:CheY-like chemotaxis protein